MINTLPLVLRNQQWGHRCQFCDEPVLSAADGTFVCLGHYMSRCAEMNLENPAPYNPVFPTFHISVYADGSCEGNPGRAGYGLVMIAENALGEQVKQRHVGVGIGEKATNNQAEISSAIAAIKLLNKDIVHKPILVDVVSDSEYLVKGINEYIYGWMLNGWKTAQKNPVKNQPLWEELWDVSCDINHRALFTWTKGHARSTSINSRYNAVADELAKAAARTQAFTDRIIQL